MLTAFGVGMAGVVYMSLSGDEIKVPEIVGKDFLESEKELAALGLKIKRRADRPSAEKINTVLEQLPEAGETVKTGQMILVVVSKFAAEGEIPSSLKKDLETDDSDKIEEMISEKPKKAKANSNTNRKKAETTRDVNANTANSTSNSVSTDNPDPKNDDTEKKTPAQDSNPADKNKNAMTGPAPKPKGTPGPNKPSSVKPGSATKP